MMWLISAVMITSFVECHQTPPTPTHVSSINSLREKMLSPTLDPKLRRALLRVLSKLEKGALPIDPETELSDEDFLNIFGQPPEPSEDLGSIESKEILDERPPFIPTKTPAQILAENKASEEKFNGQLFTYIPPTVETNKRPNYQGNSDERYPNYGYSYIPPPTDTSIQPDYNQTEYQPTKPTPDQNDNDVSFQMPTPIDIPDQVGEMTPDKDYEEVTQQEDDSERTTTPSGEDFSDVDIDVRVEDNNSTEVEVSESITREIKESNSTVGNGTEKVYKHEVEFLPSSLVAAFTVQQDDKGIPRKIIPLDDIHQQKALVEKKQKELLEKEYKLQQQLRSLQEEKYRFQGALENDGILPKPRFPAITTSIVPSVNIFSEPLAKLQLKNQENQLRDQQELQRLRILEQERQEDYRRQQEFQRQELHRQQEANRLLLRQQEFQRQREANRPYNPNLALFPPSPVQYNGFQNKFNNYNQFQKSQQIDFQKSVDYRIPTSIGFQSPQQSFNTFGPLSNYQHQPNVELNRVNRKEPQQYVGNFGLRPPSVDYQLQNLIVQSGVSTFLPSDNRDDLNIVSKVLSLNHGGFPKDNFSKSSEIISAYISPPSNVIQPPF
uniref:Uncharacterized protein n=1 Tax=Rhodnius prolixus TaxID=13249 RepID=T1HTV8_RHOPR